MITREGGINLQENRDNDAILFSTPLIFPKCKGHSRTGVIAWKAGLRVELVYRGLGKVTRSNGVSRDGQFRKGTAGS